MYKRILLKLSGEALAGENPGVHFNDEIIFEIIRQLQEVQQKGTEISLVIGGGNFWRGRSADSAMDRTKADQLGMLATIMNGIYVADCIRQKNMRARVMTPFPVGAMTELFSKDKALTYLEQNEVLIFAGGIGHPYFSTDTITALRGAELSADGLFFAKNVDGVYDSDPAVCPQAKKLSEIRCKDIIAKDLKVIDISAANLCQEQKIPVVIFGLREKNSIVRAVSGEKIGTKVTV